MSDKKFSVWRIRVCSECGAQHNIRQLWHWHGPFDAPTERFPVEEVEVIPVEQLAKVEAERDAARETIHRIDTASIGALERIDAWEGGVVSSIRRLGERLAASERFKERLTSAAVIKAAVEAADDLYDKTVGKATDTEMAAVQIEAALKAVEERG